MWASFPPSRDKREGLDFLLSTLTSIGESSEGCTTLETLGADGTEDLADPADSFLPQAEKTIAEVTTESASIAESSFFIFIPQSI